MEWEGESLVAIVRSSGPLSVTLLPDRCCCRNLDLAPKSPTRVTQSNVNTNTERVTRDASVPISDIRYASSYQFANSFPRLPSFPQHELYDSNKYNLDCGSGETGQLSDAYNRGFVYHGRSSFFKPFVDPFAQSLRKYPAHTTSSELIQRILTYTQSKRRSKGSHTKSKISLRKSASQQTRRYLDTGVNTTSDIYRRRSIKRSYSSIGNRYSSQREFLRYTYDYLKNTSLMCQDTDVRYLTQVKKAIRDRLLELLDDQPVICPKMRKRYSHHRRYHHGTTPTMQNKSAEIQESPKETRSLGLPGSPSIKSSSQKTCFCGRTKPCSCKTSAEKKPETIESIFGKLCTELDYNKQGIPRPYMKPETEVPAHLASRDTDNIRYQQLLKEINDWLKDLPVFGPEDKAKQEELVHNLMELVKNLRDRNDFIASAKQKILEYLKVLPMWRPKVFKDESKFLDEIANKLLERIKKLIHDDKEANQLGLPPSKYRELGVDSAAERKDEQLMKEVNDWLKDVPVHPTFSPEDRAKQEELVNNLIERLRNLRDSNEFLAKAKQEILEYLKIMPMWRPKNIKDESKFLNEIANELLKKINQFKYDDIENIDDIVRNEIDNLLLLTDTADIHDKDKIIVEFLNKLKDVLSNLQQDDSDNRDILKSKIVNLINDLLLPQLKDLKSELVNKIAEKLADKLHQVKRSLSISTEGLKSEDIEKNVYDWVKIIPGFLDEDIEKQSDLVNSLLTKIKKLYEPSDKKEKDLQQDILEEVNNWLDYAALQLNRRFSSKTKQQLANRLVKEMLGAHLKKTRPRNIKQYDISDTNMKLIKGWLQSIPGFSKGDETEIKRDLQNLATELKQIQTGNKNIEQILGEIKYSITNWFQNILSKRGQQMDPMDQENLINNLMSKLNQSLKSTRERSKEQVTDIRQLHKDVVSWLNDIPYIKIDSQLDKSKEVGDFINELNDLWKNSLDDEVIVKRTKNAIKKFVDDLNKNTGVKIDKKDVDLLQKRILSRLLYSKPQRKRWSKGEQIQQKREEQHRSVFREISDMMDNCEYDLDKDEIKYIKTKIPQVIIENLDDMQNIDWEKIQNQISRALKNDVHLAESEIHDLSRNIVERIQNKFDLDTMKPKVPSKRVKSYKQGYIGAPQKTKRKYYRKATPGNILDESDILEDSEISDVTPERLSTFHEHYAEKDTDIATIHKSSTSDLNISADSRKFEPYRADKIFTTSTPQTSTGKYQFSMPVSPIDGDYYDDKTLSTKFKSIDSAQYLDNVKNIIDDWFKSLNLNITEADRNNLINNIASDLLDRQKYLQISKMKSHGPDELEHLKYQIFRRVNKIGNLESMPQIMKRISDLYKRIASVKVPVLTSFKPRKFTDEIRYDLEHTSITKARDHIQYLSKAILDWLNSSPLGQRRNTQEKMLLQSTLSKLSAELKNIHESSLAKSDTELDELLVQKIINYLQKIPLAPEEKDDMFLNENANELLRYLKQLQVLPYKRDKEMIGDLISRSEENQIHLQNIKKAVEHWTQKLPLEQSTALVDIQDIIDEFVDNINSYLTNINDSSIVENQLQNDIVSFISKLPLTNKNDITSQVEMLTQLIKDLYSAQYQGEVKDIEKFTENYFREIIDSWTENLPIHVGYTEKDKEIAKTIKQDIARKLLSKLGQLHLDPGVVKHDSLFEHILKEEIEKVFETVPMNRELEKKLSLLKEILIDKLKHIKTEVQDELMGMTYKQLLKNAISKTLPFDGNLSAEEKDSFDLLKEKLADTFINLHYYGDDVEMRNKFKKKLYEEINKYCENYLKRFPATPLDTTKINEELYSALKRVSIPKEESIKSEVEKIKLKDTISEWFNDLPLGKLEKTSLPSKKMISSLAKELHDIRNKYKLNPNMDKNKEMLDVIENWLQNLPLPREKASTIPDLANKLLKKIKSECDIDKEGVSRLDKSLVGTKPDTSTSKSDKEKATSIEDTTQYSYLYAPSSLSVEERAHLKRIRYRQNMPPGKTLLPDGRIDSSLGPCLKETDVQTEHGDKKEEFIQTSKTSLLDQSSMSKVMSPHVIVKEYYWDSYESKESLPSHVSVTFSPPNPVSKGKKYDKLLPKTPKEQTDTKSAQTSDIEYTQTLMEDMTKRLRPLSKSPKIAEELGPTSKEIVQRRDHIDKSEQIYQRHPQPYQEIGPNTTYERHRARIIGSLDDLKVTTRGTGQAKLVDDLSPLRDGCAYRQRVCTAPDDIEAQRHRLNNAYCSCKERMLSKCRSRKQAGCRQHSNALRNCSKCCGGYCPHPSYLYFKKDF